MLAEIRIAPGIVSAIEQREDAAQVWGRIYRELILRCVGMIKAGDFDGSYRLYKEYTLGLQGEFM